MRHESSVLPSNISRHLGGIKFIWSIRLVWFGEQEKQDRPDSPDDLPRARASLPIPHPLPLTPPSPSHNRLLSDEHFTVDDQRSEALEGQNRFKPKGTSVNLVKSTDWLN